MAVSRLKTWIVEILTASDLNAEFNNILNNGEDLGWPATKGKDMNAQSLILDGDQDTHITADTDDRIDFSLGGFDGVRMDGTTASIVNGFDLTMQTTGVAPELKSRGESNIGMELQDSNGNETLILGSTASAVNEVTVTNAATGSGPSIAATGGDTNINLDLQPKGTSGIRLLDKNGNEILVGADGTASAVNEVTVTNAATGNAPSLSATGGDSDIGLNILPKGTGGLTVTITDGGAAGGPDLDLWRNSASPAVGDSIGRVRFLGEDDGSAQTIYGTVEGFILDETGGTEDGRVKVRTIVNASLGDRLFIDNGVHTPSATGGDQGADTINAGAIYDDGVLIDLQGIAKAWANWDGSGTIAIRASYNVDSVTDNGVGDTTVTFTTDFSNNDYVVSYTTNQITAGDPRNACQIYNLDDSGMLVGSCRVFHGGTTTSTGDDVTVNCAAFFGDQ